MSGGAPDPAEILEELRPAVTAAVELAAVETDPLALEELGAGLVPAPVAGALPAEVVAAAVELAEATPGALPLLMAAVAAGPPQVALPSAQAAERLRGGGARPSPAALRAGTLRAAQAWVAAAEGGGERLSVVCTREGSRREELVTFALEPAGRGERAVAGAAVRPRPGRWRGTVPAGAAPLDLVTAGELVADALEGNLLAGLGPEADGYEWLPLAVRALGVPGGEDLLAGVAALPPVDLEQLLAEEEPDEELAAALDARVQELADALQAWLDAGPVTADAGAETLWIGEAMFAFLAGELADPAGWTPPAVEAFLLDHAPRRLLIGPEDLPGVPEAVATVLEWLATTGRADAAAAGAAAGRARELADRFVSGYEASEADEGPAGRLVRMMMDEGVDPSDPAAVQAWLDAWNALPQDERVRRLPMPGDPPPGAPARPPRGGGAEAEHARRRRRTQRDARKRGRPKR